MKQVGILTFQDGFNRGACDFYPLIKWRKELRREKIQINFFRSHKNKKLLQQDIVGIDHRYYRELTVLRNIYPDKEFMIETIQKLKSKSIRVLLFDNGDAGGGRQWDMIQHVDVLVKKQLFRKREDYTKNNGVYSFIPFAREYNLSESKAQKNIDYKKEYVPCPPDQLHKIKLGWNIGMKDYRYFPLSYFYPVGTSRMLNQIYSQLSFKEPDEERPIDSSFRGKINSKSENYSYQRNKVIELFTDKKYSNLITGDTVSKRKYLSELKRSKTCVSPYGWGEVCYRDFETIICGALMIKPDMDHLETWPDIYKKNETYVPLKWDMSDLETKLNDVINHYEQYLQCVHCAQKIYKNAINDPDRFIDHLVDTFDIN
jgi:hypothetical protein